MIFSRWRVPAWSAFQDRKTHDAFLEVVRARLREVGRAVDEDEDGPVLDLGDGDTLDLAAATVDGAAAPPDAWEEVVRGHVASATNPNRPPRDPEGMRSAVRVRLVRFDTLQQFPKALPHRRHVDLAEVLVVTARGSIVWAGEEDLAALGRSLDELFALGRANVRSEERPRLRTLETEHGSITVAERSGDEVAHWALLVDDLIDVPAAGVSIAAPTRHTLLIGPPGDATAAAIEDLRTMAAARAAAGPATLSAHPYLWRDGELSRQEPGG